MDGENTRESEIVWTRTHRFSGQLMLACGLLLLCINAMPHLEERQIWLILSVVGLWLLATLIYAFTAWRAENPAR